MKTHVRSFDQLPTVEQSLRVEGPWRGCFELDGHHVRCAMDSEEWLHLSVPLAGNEREWVRRQSGLLLPVKVVAGPKLVAELPLTDDLASTFCALRAVVREALALLASEGDAVRGVEREDADLNARLASAVEESAFTWQRDPEHLSTKVGIARVVAKASGASAVFRTNIVRLGQSTGPSLDALTDFVLAANARFRFVRGTFVPGRLVQEVAWPMAVLTPTLVNRAVRALSDSFRMTKRACAALVDGHVAEQYLEFHRHRKDNHADTDD